MGRASSDRPSLLIIHPGTLGDVILSIEAIRSLRQWLPNHTVICVAQSEVANFLLECGEVDFVWTLEGSVLSGLLSGHHQVIPDVGRLLSRCTHAVCWLSDPEGCLEAGLQRSGVETFLICSAKDEKLQSIHMADRFLEVLQPWGVPAFREFRPLLSQMKNGNGNGASGVAPRIGNVGGREAIIMVHPGSGSPHKCCPPDQLGQVIRRLSNVSGRKIVCCGGPSDRVALKSLEKELYGLPYDVVYEKNLAYLARFLQRVSVFLGHDSGLTHLAAALGVHTVALFGPTDPLIWGPRGSHVSFVQGLQCRCKIWSVVQRCTTKICLDLSVDQVVQVIEQQLVKVGFSSVESRHHESQENAFSLAASK